MTHKKGTLNDAAEGTPKMAKFKVSVSVEKSGYSNLLHYEIVFRYPPTILKMEAV